jgi:hypothetical protein
LSERAIVAYAHGSVSQEERESIGRHIGECALCRKVVSAVEMSQTLAAGAGATAALAPETRVGRYVVKRCLGEGAMGTVYEAVDPDLDRHVALKLLRDRHDTEDLQARLLHEAKAMARVSHPEVVGVYDIGTFGDQIFLAMELVRGGTVREWLQRTRPSWRDSLGVFMRAGRGLAAAHAAGLVHRDFKPENVLIGDDGRVRVSDFGLARVAQESAAASLRGGAAAPAVSAWRTRTGAMLGTPAYMAPEQWRGDVAGPAADQFSFCVALHEALFGERPFAGDTIKDLHPNVLCGRMRGPPPGVRVPAWVRAAIVRGLQTTPEARHPSMDALLAALERPSRSGAFALGIGVAMVLAAGGVVAGFVVAKKPRVTIASAEVPAAPAPLPAQAATVDPAPSASTVTSEAARAAPSTAQVAGLAPAPAISSSAPRLKPAAPAGKAAAPVRKPLKVYRSNMSCLHVCNTVGAFSEDIDAHIGAVYSCWAQVREDPVDHSFVMWNITLNADGVVTKVFPMGEGDRSARLDGCMGTVLRGIHFHDVEAAGTFQVGFSSNEGKWD